MFRSILNLISLLFLLLISSSVAAAPGLSSHQYRVLSQAQKLLQNGDLASAQAASKSLLPLLANEHVPLTIYHYACRAAAEAQQSITVIQDCWQRAHNDYPNEQAPALQLAQLHLQAQRYQQALPLLEPWLAEPNVRYQYGYGLYNLGRYQRLLELLQLNDQQPVPLNWLPLRAYSALNLENWPLLQREAESWLAREPNKPEAWQLLAHAQIQLGQPQQAASSLEMLSLLRPQQNRQPLLQLYQQLQAHNLAAECLTQDPDLSCLQQGYLAGKYQQTLAAVERTQIPPAQQDQLLLLRGRLHSALKQPQQARQQWQQVGKNPLPQAKSEQLKALRQQRERLRGQALLLIGQSYWLAQQWPEAQMTYRELERLPSFTGNAKALLNNLAFYTQRYGE